MLRPQDLAFTILGAHARGRDQAVWSGGMVDLLGELGLSTEAARAALARLVGHGLLARERRGRLVYYTLTSSASALLAEGDRRIFTFGRVETGEEVWTVLFHTIPEDRRVERARLAARLRFLGFGSVQDGTWVAARDREHEVLGVLGELGVKEFAAMIVGRFSGALAPVALIAEAWDLEQVEGLYAEFAADFGVYRRAGDRRRLSERDAFVTRTLVLHRFRGFAFVDPELPGARTTLARRRRKVVEIFDAVYEGLAEPAESHFAAAAGGEDASLRSPPGLRAPSPG